MADNINKQNENTPDNPELMTDTATSSVKKRKVWRIVLIILLILAVIIGALCIRYKDYVRMLTWENINAFIQSRKYSKEELEKQMEENKMKIEQIAEESPHINIRGELTPEETEALKNGEITHEEAMLIVKGDITLEEIRQNKQEESQQGDDPQQPSPEEPPRQDSTGDTEPSTGNSSTATEQAPQSAPRDRVSELISEMHVLQADFINQIETIGDRAYADYKATRYDRSKVMTIVDSYVGEVSELEKTCDKKISGLVSELRAELEKVGGDKSIADDVIMYYYREKSLKKSYYLDRLDDEDYK